MHPLQHAPSSTSALHLERSALARTQVLTTVRLPTLDSQSLCVLLRWRSISRLLASRRYKEPSQSDDVYAPEMQADSRNYVIEELRDTEESCVMHTATVAQGVIERGLVVK